MKPLRRLLIANRGEIACRVMRTAQAMGIYCIAVYSDADADAPHVKLADEAIHIGPSAAAESYLVIDRIIKAAQSSGADAIHPGYGFLSERATFATACAEAGITFVGPSPQAIDLMGDKARSKRAMIEAGVPCIPGYQGEAQDDKTLTAEGLRVGFPLMVKAAAGGGGKGMRLIHREKDLASGIAAARSEGESSFGSGELILEKAIIRPRHVEVQVFGDNHGNIVHLGERDCSVQRRHQKVVEEAPCPVMTPQLREKMGRAAVEAARAVNYSGAGTVEFLLADDGSFYFLEMNTRLQVEHPVTELVTGLDLVELQLRVAQDLPLGFTQENIILNGHAMEVRYYAEDPSNDFTPGGGPIALWHVPKIPGLRVDDGIETGGEVSPFYDPMVAKVIAYGASREEARAILVQGLKKSALIGPANNRDFLIDVLSRPTFVEGKATTAFIADEYGNEGFAQEIGREDLQIAAILLHEGVAVEMRGAALRVCDELAGWSSAGTLTSMYEFLISDELVRVQIRSTGNVLKQAVLGESQMEYRLIRLNDGAAELLVGGRRLEIRFNRSLDHTFTVATPDKQFVLLRHIAGSQDADAASSGIVTAPMHGKVVNLLTAKGAAVAADEPVAVIEAMKMQQEIRAPVAGTVSRIAVEVGAQIALGDVLLEIDSEEEEVL